MPKRGKSGRGPRKPRPPQRRILTQSIQKRFTKRNGQKVLAHQTLKRFRTSVKVKKGADYGKLFKQHVEPEFEKFVRRKLRSKQGNFFILRIATTHSGKGFRRKQYFSGNRVEIRGIGKGYKEYIDKVTKQFVKSFEEYLKRKGMTSISITGVHLEVSKKESRVVSFKTARSSRRSKK